MPDNEEVEDEAQEAAETTQPDQDTDGEKPDEPEEETTEDAWDPKRAQAKIQKLNREAAALREKAKTAEKSTQQAADLNEKVTALEAANLRLEVALDLGLPTTLAKRLTGTTTEEIRQDAEELLKLVAPQSKPVTRSPNVRLRGGGEPDAEPEETDLDKIAADMFKR